MYPLMPLQVVVPVEGLGARGAFEWAVGLRRRAARMNIDVVWMVWRQARMMAIAGESRHAANHGQRSARVMHVAQNRAWDRIIRGIG
jgi:hypothetical protein